MVRRVRMRQQAVASLRRRAGLTVGSSRRRAGLVLASLAALAALVALSGCGSSLRDGGSEDAVADVDATTRADCPTSVVQALAGVAKRVYREGISSERTVTALRMVETSAALRAAVEHDDARAAQAAGRALIATGHMTNLRVLRGRRVLVDLGGAALTPLNGKISTSAGKPLASFQTSVWTDGGLIAEVNGIAEAQTVLRTADAPASGQRDVAGTIALPPGELPAQGTFTRNGKAYEFTSFAAAAYPAGAPLRVFLLRSVASTAPLCGSSDEDTAFNTISRIAHLIYDGEVGKRTLVQVHRVQANAPLLRAVAQRDPTATRAAVAALLHQHIVRLRVSAGGRLLADDGGPYVLAPVTAPLRAGGRTIGSFVLSIQDDEGYKRLANRLAGLDVLMYMGSKLVKSTLGPSPGAIPTSGKVSLRGSSYRAYTFDGKAFPSGPLRITTLVPMPYR